MAHTHAEKKDRSAKDLVPPLLLGALGTVGVVVVYLLVPGFEFIDMVLMLLVVGFVTLGYRQRFLRGCLTFAFLYVATGVAATFYDPTSPYIGAPFGGEKTDLTRALAFVVLTLAVWIALEGISRYFFKDTSLPKLSILDNVGGAFVYFIIGVLFVALLYNALGYAQGMQYPKAQLRSTFQQVVTIHYTTQIFWFPEGKPLLYLYGLDLSSEP
jgi:uncharacterized membrane protein required for colicin V production